MSFYSERELNPVLFTLRDQVEVRALALVNPVLWIIQHVASTEVYGITPAEPVFQVEVQLVKLREENFPFSVKNKLRKNLVEGVDAHVLVILARPQAAGAVNAQAHLQAAHDALAAQLGEVTQKLIAARAATQAAIGEWAAMPHRTTEQLMRRVMTKAAEAEAAA